MLTVAQEMHCLAHTMTVWGHLSPYGVSEVARSLDLELWAAA
jgi:hypothetical protein